MAIENKTASDESFWIQWILPLVVAALIVIAGRAMVGSMLTYPARYAATALFGLLVGTTELVSRYRDNPVAPLTTMPGLIYIATNVFASIGALWVLLRNGVQYDFGGVLPKDLAQVLLAGFGTMVLFRSSLFTVRIGDADVSIGPAAVLQIILNAADRACDRLRAGPRAERVKQIMRGVSFNKAKVALPLHCFALMQNVSTAEQTQLMQLIDRMVKEDLTDDVKAYNLGLLMMNVVGEEVLEKAVNVLGSLVLVPPDDEPPILTNVASLKSEDANALLEICIALDPQAREDVTSDVFRIEIQKDTQEIEAVGVRNIVILMRLRKRFGPTTVSRALALLQSSRQPVGKTSTGRLTESDLLGTAGSKPEGSSHGAGEDSGANASGGQSGAGTAPDASHPSGGEAPRPAVEGSAAPAAAGGSVAEPIGTQGTEPPPTGEYRGAGAPEGEPTPDVERKGAREDKEPGRS
jgi:hypothetical protein